MPKGRNSPPDNKEERGQLLSKVVTLAPLIAVVLQFLELTLKLLGVIE